MVNDEWSGAGALENAFRVAYEELRKAQRERDVALRKKGEAFDRVVRAERERDEWKARAEKAEREREQYRRSGDEWIECHADAVRERDAAVARAEQAENARDTVATRAAQLEKALAASRDAHQRSADAHMEWKSRAEAAEARTDPVEEKARELYRAATPDARWETVADEYRRIAAHVLGQEDRHVDQ